MSVSKTVLVTGGAGFVGGHLVEALLDRGWRVICLDLFTYAASLDHLSAAMERHGHQIVDRVPPRRLLRDRAHRLVIVRGDINDSATIVALLAECDGVLALAAETHVDYSYHTPGTFVRANINGTAGLLEAMRLAGLDKRLLHVSTDEVYGQTLRGRVAETAPLGPRNVYAATKACGDLLVRTYAEVFDLNVVVVRPCNLIGPRQQPKDLIPKTFGRLLQGRKMTIHGDGRHVREYLYVRDAAEMMIELFLHGARGEAYNLGAGAHHSTREVVRTVAESLGRKFNDVVTYVPDRPNADRRYAVDNRKARRLLGRRWRITPFAEVIRLMRDDFLARRPAPLP